VLICRNAEGVHDQKKFGNPCSRGSNKAQNIVLLRGQIREVMGGSYSTDVTIYICLCFVWYPRL